MTKTSVLSFLLYQILYLFCLPNNNLVSAAGGGQWVLLKQDIGIVAMHMQLLNNDRVIIYDRTDFGQSNISLSGTKCPSNDCTAHSIEYDVSANSVRPLTVQTDVWCSSGTVDPNGQLIQTGGSGAGDRVIRTFTPCSTCDWKESPNSLLAGRWYATNHILPDGRAIIVGGRARFNYEFYPKTSATSSLFSLPLLSQTNDPSQENNLYPFVHLNVDGNLFIYANNAAILLDYTKNVIARTYPSMPGGDPRNYPSTGSSVLLPLRNIGVASVVAEVLICGGAPKGSYPQAKAGKFIAALNTCGKLKITDAAPTWQMESMPSARVMGDMVLLPNTQVLIINGAGSGTAGWEYARNPVLRPVVYRQKNLPSTRFESQNPSSIPRMYHSTAILLRDGRVLVGGSNTHAHYSYTGVLFPTELRLEAFSPTYLDSQVSSLRPKILSTSPQVPLKHSQLLTISYSAPSTLLREVVVTLVAPSFATHSFSMNQRLLVLDRQGNSHRVSNTTYTVVAKMPFTSSLAPPGYYMLFVNYQDIPSEGVWIQIQ